MGLSPEVKHIILEEDAKTKRIWQDGAPPVEEGKNAVIVDSLPSLRMIINHENNYQPTGFTGDSLFWAWMNPFVKLFQEGYGVVVSLYDDADRVPSQKAAEQKARSAASTVKPYTGATRFTPFGLVINGKVELVDRDRLCASRYLRKPLCRLYLSKLRNDQLRRSVIKPGCRLVLDFEASGPWLITQTKVVQLTALKHPFGEADLMIPYWLHILRHQPRYVRTIDGDIFLIILNYIHQHGVAHPIYYEWLRKKPLARQPKPVEEEEEENNKPWAGIVEGEETIEENKEEKKKKSKPKAKAKAKAKAKSKAKTNKVKDGIVYAKEQTRGYIDMEEMRIAIGDRLWPFTLACVLCGTDFHHKGSLIMGIGDEHIINWGLSMDVHSDYKNRTLWDLTDAVEGRANIWPWAFSSNIHMKKWYDRRGGDRESKEESKRERRIEPPIPQTDESNTRMLPPDLFEDIESEEKEKKKENPREAKRQALLDAESKRIAHISDESSTSKISRLFLQMLNAVHTYAEIQKGSKKSIPVAFSTVGRSTCMWNLQYWLANMELFGVHAVLPGVDDNNDDDVAVVDL